MKMNIYDIAPLKSDAEIITILAEHKNVRIERIVSTGQTSDWYDQDQYEFVILLEGRAKLEFEGDEVISLNRGDTLMIYPHQKHRVAETSKAPPCIWICVFFDA
jgi:cupin 2 domain-containing protein